MATNNVNTTEIPLTISGNEKRIKSCKKIGGDKKKLGHAHEKDFLERYNKSKLDEPTEYGATSDTSINPEHLICSSLYESIKPSNLDVSNKSGKSIQFILGKIPEFVEEPDSIVDKLNNDKDFKQTIMNKYLKKIESSKPAGILAYRYKDNNEDKWIFFNTDDIVEFICEKCKWRSTKGKRIKGDFEDKSSKGYSQYITYEYRPKHKSQFLGVNCGNGLKFIKLLMDPYFGIKHYIDKINV